jgi:UDP-glucose 4-epimerase
VNEDRESGVPELTGERILVTGGSGFIGRTVVPALLAAGARVSVLDRRPYPAGQVRSVVGDLREPAVREAAVAGDLTGIVHLAAVTSVLGSLADPELVHEVNVDGTARLLELARLRSVPRFLMASTNATRGCRCARSPRTGPPRPRRRCCCPATRAATA